MNGSRPLRRPRQRAIAYNLNAMNEEKGGFYSELNSNHKQWLLCGLPGPPLLLAAWISSLVGGPQEGGLTVWGLALCALAAVLLPIRSVVSLIDKDKRRVTLSFFALAVINGLPLFLLTR